MRKTIISLLIVALTTSFAFAAKPGTGEDPASFVKVATFTQDSVLADSGLEGRVLLLDDKVNSFLTANQITDVISITDVVIKGPAEYSPSGLIRTVTYRE